MRSLNFHSWHGNKGELNVCAHVQVVDLTGLVLDAFGGELRSWSLKNSVTVNLPKPTNTNTSLRFNSSLRGTTLGVKVHVLSQ